MWRFSSLPLSLFPLRMPLGACFLQRADLGTASFLPFQANGCLCLQQHPFPIYAAAIHSGSRQCPVHAKCIYSVRAVFPRRKVTHSLQAKQRAGSMHMHESKNAAACSQVRHHTTYKACCLKRDPFSTLLLSKGERLLPRPSPILPAWKSFLLLFPKVIHR